MLKKDGKKTDWKNIEINECLYGNALDAHYTLKIYNKLLNEVQGVGLEKFYEKLISPLTIVFRDIEYYGMDIDVEKLNEIKKQLEFLLEKNKNEMMNSKYIPKDYKLSGHNLLEILFSLKKNGDSWDINESVGFGLYPVSRTKKGQPSTDSEDMIKLKELVDKEYLRRGLNETNKNEAG